MDKPESIEDKEHRVLMEIWEELDIGHHFTKYEYDEEKGEFSCTIEKKVIRHQGDLWEDYVRFLKEIIVPITKEIKYCVISSDDFGYRTQQYTDMELRNKELRFKEIVKQIEHIYDEDGDIVATHIEYKRPIKKLYVVDLSRLYN